MADQNNIWFRLGYTLESARQRTQRSPRLRTLSERELDSDLDSDLDLDLDDIDLDEERHEPRAARKVGAARRPRPEPEELEDDLDPGIDAVDMPEGLGTIAQFLLGKAPTGESWEAVVSALGAAAVGKLLDAMPRKRRPGPIRLLHAAAAGAGAALAREALRPMMSGPTLDARPFAERARGAALRGSARGLLYGALVEPRLPGPPVMRGAMYGWVEHLVSPLGGLTTLAGAHAPHRSLPFVSNLFDELEHGADDTLMDHVLFGIALAALYGAKPADAKKHDDEDEDEDNED
ncbi:MAG: hypothetical protein EXR95_09300 [Gemmatimonadetes bacterium]|nr:hypothetical protein [Gemmatimonadota bacterium]